jgi:RNA polymerase nonessential primary-like sigma factor
LQMAEVEQYVREWMAELTEKQRWVIECRFGLNNQDVSTLEQLAVQLGVTRERVRQIQVESLQALRRILRRKGISKDGLL